MIPFAPDVIVPKFAGDERTIVGMAASWFISDDIVLDFDDNEEGSHLMTYDRRTRSVVSFLEVL